MKKLHLAVAADRRSYHAGEAIRVRVEIRNADTAAVDVTIPAGVDQTRMFEYSALEVASGVMWEGSVSTSRSLVGDWRRIIAPGERIDFKATLRFRRSGGEYALSLPIGSYSLNCIFYEQRAITPSNRSPTVLRSDPSSFVVSAKS